MVYRSEPATDLTLEGVRIDPEFQGLVPPLRDAERAQLRANIRESGCRDALVVWRGTLVDGHHRYRICRELGIEPQIVSIDFPSREAAIEWIVLNQVGKRNLTGRWFDYFVGKRYLLERAGHGGPRSSAQNEHLGDRATHIARETGCSPAKVRRKAKVVEQLDRIESAAPGERRRILDRERRVSDSELTRLAEVPDPEIPAALERLSRQPEHPPAIDTGEGNVDAIFASVPWVSAVSGPFERIGRVARERLRTGGSLLLAVDPRNAADAQRVLSTMLRHHWVLTRVNPAPAVRVKNGVVSRCTPVLWFVKREYEGAPVTDPLGLDGEIWPVEELVPAGGTVGLVDGLALGHEVGDRKLVSIGLDAPPAGATGRTESGLSTVSATA